MASHEKPADDDVIVIKKYANRRLYNTATSSYVTLDYLAEMVRQEEEFVVYDAKSGEDITRSVLTQIIFDEENKGQNLLPVKFLRQIIGYYGDNMQSFVPSYLEMSMEAFQKNQDAMRNSMSGAFSEAPGMKMFEDVTRQNMALFEQGMKMFGVGGTPWSATTSGDDAPGDLEAENAELKRQIAELKAKLSEK
jgi:polyhydroxyalkanoate synthesis repressor PhaR